MAQLRLLPAQSSWPSSLRYGALALLIGSGAVACKSEKPDSGAAPAPVATEGPSPKGDVPAPANLAPAEGDAACARAEGCCRAMVKKLPAAQQNFGPCSDVKKMAAINCVPMFEKYQQAARALGATCE